MTKIFLATPVFLGQVHIQFALSLAETAVLLNHHKIPLELHLIYSTTELVESRNQIIQDFLNSDSTHLLMIDADLGWPPEAVLNLIKKDVDIIGGCYPSRNDRLFRYRPLMNKDKSLVVNNSCLEMETIPAGFMLIKRQVIEKAMSEQPLFRTGIMGGQFWGEDYCFCKALRKSGFTILVDPAIFFNHDGFTGKLADALIYKNPEKS